MKNISYSRIFSAVVIFALLLVLAPAVTYISTVFGWANPAQNPPGGSGAILVDQSNGNVGIKTLLTASTTLTVNGEVSVAGRIRNVTSPVDGNDAVTKDYLLASGAGGGSLVLFYKTLSNLPPSPPSCPNGYTPLSWTGYGPHYLGILGYDWYMNGSGGSGGGFGGTPPPVPDGGTNGASYYLSTMAIGSDSTCSQDQTTVVPFSQIYNNQLSTGFTSMLADACFTNTSTGVTECNRCIVCQK